MTPADDPLATKVYLAALHRAGDRNQESSPDTWFLVSLAIPEVRQVKLIIAFLLLVATALTTLLVANILHLLPPLLAPLRVVITCAALGGLGGCIYCLRGVYLNACVYKRWDDDWQPWYYIRPLVSVGCGAVSYIFLRAGLLVLESGKRPDSTDLGFYALAFIAGLNVDKFIVKIEDIAQAVWGIERSRAASRSSTETK